MEKYLQQLIEDMQARAKLAPPPYGMIPREGMAMEEMKPYDFEKSFEEAERLVTGEPDFLSNQLGFEKLQFPSPEELTEEQIDMLVDEILKLWLAYHLVPDFPKNLPTLERYKLIRDYFDKELVLISIGEVHIEFCDFEPARCPFPEYCSSCRDPYEMLTLEDFEELLGDYPN